MEWKNLLSPKRMGMYQPKRKGAYTHTDLRSEFEKDYHRIIGSASFRRLQDKTQVFPLDKSDFIRTRLTHSLEVSSFAKSLGQNIAQYILQNHLDEAFTSVEKEDICDILQCAGLIHDIGNPPFGHFGEEAIRDWFCRRLPEMTCEGKPVTEILNDQMLGDLYHFEGNAQALRLVTKLHHLVNENGMNLTYGLLNTIMKYPVSSVGIDKEAGDIRKKKMGYFYAEQELFDDVQKSTTANGKRHPLTFILEAADDIAYRTADIEDSFKKGRLSYDNLIKELKIFQEKARLQWEENQRSSDHGQTDAETGHSDKHTCGYTDAVEMLQHQYDNGVKRGMKDPQLYAVQNWVVRVQSAMIFCATDGFVSNYDAIMEGNYRFDLFHNTAGEWLMHALGDIAYRYTFISQPILKLEVAANNIINYFMDQMIPAAIQYDSAEPMGMIEKKMMALISENYREIYHFYAKDRTEAEKLYLRLLLVTDFISGMTDSYAKNLYQELKGIV